MDLPAYIDRTEPSSPTTTPAPTSNPSEEPPRSLAELKQLGRTVYKEVWDEFYDWEPGYCSDILGTVTQSFIATQHEVAHVARAGVARLLDNSALRAPSAVDGPAVVTVVAAESGGPCVARVSVPVVTIELSTVKPHPRYESCPPSSKSMRVDDHHLQFLPYADDEQFPSVKFQATFDVLEWEKPFDPDMEMIQIETVKRLHAIHRVDRDDIDRMEMFKQKLRESHNQGLLWEQSQRDALHWPGASRFKTEQEEELHITHTPDANNLRQRLMNNLAVFCPCLNCLHAVCETHYKDHANNYIPSRKPQLTGHGLMLSEGDPCGPDCFRHIQDPERFMESLCPSSPISHQLSSIDTLETILGLAPDLLPCELAIICLRPCKQVFVQRLQLFPDDTILSSSFSDLSLVGDSNRESRHIQQRKRTKPVFVDNKPLTCPILNACAHPGPCTSNNCPCFVAKYHCTLMCRCGVKCERQWQGCHCAIGRCYDQSCSCSIGGRECIPGICNNCDARGSFGKPCPNTKMQHQAGKPVEVKCGTYGLGAFAVSDMRKNTFLGSYVGHILPSKVADVRHELSKHVGLNYLFDVAQDEEIDDLPIFDAAYLSNATRFLNHNKKDNVDAKVKVVNGEYQIGFFTKKGIKKGKELFINYGEKYWTG